MQLLYAQPVYALMLQKCRMRWDPRVKTAGVRPLANGSVELSVAPEFFDSLSDLHNVGLLMHEMLHLFMEHFTRGKGLDPKLRNIAMDLAINQYIPAEMLPPEGLLPEMYGLPKGEAFEFYYKALLAQSKDAQENGTPQPGGNSVDNHDWESEAAELDAQELTDAAEAVASGAVAEEIKRKAIQRVALDAAAAAKRTFPGRFPMHLETLIAELIAPPKLDWRRELRSFIGRHRAPLNESTRTRANRRLGLAAQGSKPTYFPKILVALDESGSVGEPTRQALLAEIRCILRNADGGTEVIHFDTKIAKKATLRKAGDLKTTRYARGGTDFNCVFDHARQTRPDLVIVLTDGGADAPRGKLGAPVVWVIADGDGKHLPGKKIDLNTEEETDAA
jgi:predicted metal-dependent peptidase